MLPFSNRLGRTAALLIAAGFIAHAAGDGNISIAVLDVTGKAVSGATVVVSSPTQIGGSKSAVTDSTGRVRFLRLIPGKFKVTLSAEGYQAQTINSVDVLVDQTAVVSAKLIPIGGATVEVLSSISAVDTTTVTAGTQLTQEELTSLPLARNQLGTINLAPGVVSIGGNPSLAAGLNRDNFGNQGARNNTYLIDGIDVTSPEAGTYRTSIAPELVSTQDVKTGAITAEYSARAGLFSQVTTISGSNEFHGGLVEYHRSSDWWSAVGRFRPYILPSQVNDTTLFLSGPIIKDKLWFVVSGQKVKEDGTITVNPGATLTPGETRATTLNDEQRYFFKLTWAIAQGHSVFASFSRNPGSFDNLSNPNVVTSQAAKTIRGGNNYNLSYTWQTPSFILDIKGTRHEESDTTKALFTNAGPLITLQTDPAGGTIPSIQRTFGNSSADTGRLYRRDQVRADFTYLFDALGQHTLKAGMQMGKDQLTQTVGISQGVFYDNLGPIGNVAANGGPSFNLVDTKYSGFVPGTGSRMLSAINNPANGYGAVITALDTNHNGTVDSDELNAYRFTELFDGSRPQLGYFGYRRTLDSAASSTPKMEYQGAYVQDQWQLGRWTFSPGVRFDKYDFKADNGTSLFKTDLAIAPRIGLTWDVQGDGRTKAYAYWGRYIDPIKLDMVRFTGSLSSSVQLEQIRIANTWVTENRRGGTKTIDAVFADTFKLPKTDEFRMGLAKDFGNAWSLEGVYTYRRDYDIVEDWDPTLYTSADALEDEGRSVFALPKRSVTPYASLTAAQKKVVDAFRGLVIDPNYFAGGGFTGQQNVDRVNGGTLNFVLANMPGAFRYYNTFDITVTRKFKDHWGGFATYSRVRATGNTQSSGNADFQGDLARFDPRLGYNNGSLDGSVDWLAKGYAYYKWDSGFLLGLTYNVLSGYHYSNSRVFSTRILLASPSDPALLNTELQGANLSPRYDTADLHASYDFKIGSRLKAAVYADVFNFFNKQTATDLAEGTNVRAGFGANEAYAYVPPRRFSLGVRLTF